MTDRMSFHVARLSPKSRYSSHGQQFNGIDSIVTPIVTLCVNPAEGRS